MRCPFCYSSRVTFPTTKRGIAELKVGPATCTDCGAYEERKLVDNKNLSTRWVRGSK